MACASGSSNTAGSAPNSPSGARSSTSERPFRRGRDRASRRHEQDRRPAVEANLQLRPRAAGGAAEDLGGQVRERGGGAARVLASRDDERPRRARAVEAGFGEEGGVVSKE